MAYPNTAQLAIAYLHFYVDDLLYWQKWFAHFLGLEITAISTDVPNLPQQSIALQSVDLQIILSAPNFTDHTDHLSPIQNDPVGDYLKNHPCGIADVAFFIDHKSQILEQSGQKKSFVLKNPAGFQHTLIPKTNIPFQNQRIDHLVLNVPQGYLEPTITWYEEVFGFQRQQSFQIQTNYSSLSSQVLKHDSGIQIPINQPGDRQSQIQEFLDYNGGAGVQHVALKQEHLSQTIQQLQRQGLEFLEVPPSYYQNLIQRYPHLAQLQHWSAIEATHILVDVVRSPGELLLQIFTKPIFKEPTFFWEFIERKQQAQGFGEGNFQALFEAIEQAQKQRQIKPSTPAR
jgi:4-hydroxyphenylpyruvate dioxygenase